MDKLYKSELHLQQLAYMAAWNTIPQVRGLLYHNFSNPRSAVQGAQLKACGLVAGIPDFTLAIPSKGYGALYIELKLTGQKPKSHQVDQTRKLEEAGNKCCICYTVEEVLNEIKKYLF